MSALLASRWLAQFHRALDGDHDVSADLRDASISRELRRWTIALTRVVVRSMEALDLTAAARQNAGTALPLAQQEYLGQDVMAFRPGPRGWRFPIIVAELENAPDDRRVAYSLWKTLCIRCELRIVFCYRPEPTDAAELLAVLAGDVVRELPISDRARLDGETIVVVGSRDEAATFPNGFFQAWKLNTNTGRFERLART
jgi:hypothetical protein